MNEKNPNLGRPPTLRKSIFEFLIHSKEPKTLAEIADALNRNSDHLRDSLDWLMANDVVAKVPSQREGQGHRALFYVATGAFDGDWNSLSVDEVEKIKWNVAFAWEKVQAQVIEAKLSESRVKKILKNIERHLVVRQLAGE